MSFCEFHPEYQKHLTNDFLDYQTLPNLSNELQWGLNYRNIKKKQVDSKSIPVKKSPVDIPLKLCRERERIQSAKLRKKEKIKLPSVKKETKKLSLLEKSMLSQNKYMQYLSTPNPKFEEPPLKKRKKKCQMEPCSPRLVRLATPNKRRVYENWKDYCNLLPVEMLLRFEHILYANNCLEPRDARYYYKKLDIEKRKKLKVKRSKRKKKEQLKNKSKEKWIKEEIEKTIEAIMEFVKEEPLFVLNYKQLLLSESIIHNLAKKGILKKPKRNSKKAFSITIIEICDKLALWTDTLIRFVDVQAVESDEDIPPLTISSIELSSEGEDIKGEEEDDKSDEGGWGDDDRSVGKQDDIFHFVEFGEEYGEEEYAGFPPIDQITSMDQLERLIQILSNCSEDFLDRLIHPENLPGVTYRDVLNNLIELKKQLASKTEQSFLEELILAWALQNDPNKVDSKIHLKIKEIARIVELGLIKKDKLKGKRIF